MSRGALGNDPSPDMSPDTSPDTSRARCDPSPSQEHYGVGRELEHTRNDTTE